MTDQAIPEARDYRDTLFLPKTDFPMRAGLPKAEPKWLERWAELDLYARLRERSKGREQWCLHDGPPYANGHIHMGTALNKIHKDLVNRSHQMLGYDANYVPGWDCHGLPIEWKVEEEFRAKGRAKEDVPASEFRARCREYAQHWLDIQREEFMRLGVVGDWWNPYVTMNPESEADICHELLKIAGTGQLYRGSKPIMWSPVEQTALAEAEVEYQDKKGTQIYVRFPVRQFISTTAKAKQKVGITVSERLADDTIAVAKSLINRFKEAEANLSDDEIGYKQSERQSEADKLLENASVVIWTTTPWTIPANRAVSFSKNISYGLYEITKLGNPGFPLGQSVGDRLVVADKLWNVLADASHISEYERLNDVSDYFLEDIVLSHPLAGNVQGFEYPIPLLPGDHVTDDAGTGFVHTAPSHGEDDFNVWMSNTARIEAVGADTVVPMTLDDAGCYTDVMPKRFRGLDVIRTSGKKRGQDGKANAEVIKALVESNNLLARAPITVRDAHSWRSKAPVIRRATPQWFISMSKGGLRNKALKSLDNVTFVPPRARNRLSTMVADRPDWLVSRQRAWGVPITLLVHEDGRIHTELPEADAINSKILDCVRRDGVDGWFDAEVSDFLDDTSSWTKVTDILDVWFDSGTTHAFCLKVRDDLPDRADVYLEGSDQHRGWFQSSLLESTAVYDEAPYKTVITDGFVVDEKGLKMSKSLGNTLSPLDIAKQYGVEVLRLWVASSDVTNDLKIGKEIIQTNVDAYRKLRNTLRFLLGALDGFDESERLEASKMPALERWMLHRLAEIGESHEANVRAHEHRKVFSMLFDFCNEDLSAIYFDIRKDALYCDAPSSLRRRACRTVMADVFDALVKWLAPILCFTAEEAWQLRHPEDDSVHLHDFADIPTDWRDDALAKAMAELLVQRETAQEVIEPLRRDGVIGASLEVALTVPGLEDASTALGLTDAERYADPSNPRDVLADYFIVSAATHGDALTAERLPDSYTKCARSWRYFQGEGEITPRDGAAVKALG